MWRLAAVRPQLSNICSSVINDAQQTTQLQPAGQLLLLAGQDLPLQLPQPPRHRDGGGFNPDVLQHIRLKSQDDCLNQVWINEDTA